MKGFTRREPLFSLCGLKCGLCRMHLGGYCPGCGGGEGNQSCAIARCSLEHGGPEFCWDCPEYPCARYEGFDECDSFVPHSAHARDAAEARSLGIEAYMARMRESAALLRSCSAVITTGGARPSSAPRPASCLPRTCAPSWSGCVLRRRAWN
ncbi:MAG: DUF3795 domain-containing protein [Lachnospiraceae bacterium]